MKQCGITTEYGFSERAVRILCSLLLAVSMFSGASLRVYADKILPSSLLGSRRTMPLPEIGVSGQEPVSVTQEAYARALSNLADADCPWQNILCIGDSVTKGVQAGPDLEDWPVTYPKVMSGLLGVPVYNDGIGGGCVWSGGNYPLLPLLCDHEGIDAVFLMTGYNDWFYGTDCPLGDTTAPGTFACDFLTLCQAILDRYPGADIFVVIPPTPQGHLGIEPYYDYDGLMDVEREIAASMGLRVIDLAAQGLLDGTDEGISGEYFSDFVHLNDRGYEALGALIADGALAE